MADTTEPPPPRHRRKTTDQEVRDAAAAAGMSAGAGKALAAINRVKHEHTPRENIAPKRVLGRYVETLTCKLTPLERAEKHVEVMQLLDTIERLEAELDALKKAKGASITAAKTELNNTRRVAAAGVEDRQVEVVAELDDREVSYFRADTGELLRRRPATPAELQEQLFG